MSAAEMSMRPVACRARDVRIELFRCVCMFGVCLLHALGHGGYVDAHRGLDNLMCSSVVGFVFISGWFGIKLTARHVLRLMGIALYCAFAHLVAYDWIFCGRFDLAFSAKNFWLVFVAGPWFLWCYFALMLVAPLLDPLFTTSTDGEKGDLKVLWRVLPTVLMVFGWSYAATKIPVLKKWLPHIGGFDDYGVLTFIGIYLVARTCRHYSIERWLSIRRLLLISVLAAPFCWIGMGHYHSPFALVFAASVFFLFRRVNVRDGRLARCILWLSGSTFSIYLLHRAMLGSVFMRSVERTLIGNCGWNYYLVCLMVAVGYFLGALVLDVPRRLWSCR